MKSPVFIDDTEAGYVKDLKIEAGERVAVLALTDKQVAQERIRAGIFRVVGEDGRIVLRTDEMKPDAAPLPCGLGSCCLHIHIYVSSAETYRHDHRRRTCRFLVERYAFNFAKDDRSSWQVVAS